MANPTHFSAGLCWKKNEDGRLMFLVIDSYGSYEDLEAERNPKVKFPGGTNKEFLGAKPFETLGREFSGETGIFPPKSPLQIYVVNKGSTEDGAMHTQHFFLFAFDRCTGSLRTSVIEDGGDWLGIPYWVSALDLSEGFGRGRMKKIFHSHEEPLDKAATRFGQ